jgi:hypothetical protein
MLLDELVEGYDGLGLVMSRGLGPWKHETVLLVYKSRLIL